MCGCDESMEHIITDCQASGQALIWGLVQELSLRKVSPNMWPPLSARYLGVGLQISEMRKARNRWDIVDSTQLLSQSLLTSSGGLDVNGKSKGRRTKRNCTQMLKL